MYSFLSRYGQVLAFGLGLILSLIYLIFVFSGLDAFTQLPEEEQVTTGIFNFGLMTALALIAACVIVAFIFGIFYLVTDPKNSVTFLIGLGALAVIFLVAYYTSDPNASGALAATMDEFDISAPTSQLISGALWTTLVLGGIAVASFVIAEVVNIFQ